MDSCQMNRLSASQVPQCKAIRTLQTRMRLGNVLGTVSHASRTPKGLLELQNFHITMVTNQNPLAPFQRTEPDSSRPCLRLWNSGALRRSRPRFRPLLEAPGFLMDFETFFLQHLLYGELRHASRTLDHAWLTGWLSQTAHTTKQSGNQAAHSALMTKTATPLTLLRRVTLLHLEPLGPPTVASRRGCGGGDTAALRLGYVGVLQRILQISSAYTK